jgi:hypothetical protein
MRAAGRGGAAWRVVRVCSVSSRRGANTYISGGGRAMGMRRCAADAGTDAGWRARDDGRGAPQPQRNFVWARAPGIRTSASGWSGARGRASRPVGRVEVAKKTVARMSHPNPARSPGAPLRFRPRRRRFRACVRTLYDAQFLSDFCSLRCRSLGDAVGVLTRRLACLLLLVAQTDLVSS